MKMQLSAVPHWNSKIRSKDHGQLWARSSPYCMVLFCRFEQDVVSDLQSTYRNIHDPRRVAQVIELAVYP